jgi:hypothetical protein
LSSLRISGNFFNTKILSKAVKDQKKKKNTNSKSLSSCCCLPLKLSISPFDFSLLKTYFDGLFRFLFPRPSRFVLLFFEKFVFQEERMCRVGGVIQKTFRRFFGDVLFVGKF